MPSGPTVELDGRPECCRHRDEYFSERARCPCGCWSQPADHTIPPLGWGFIHEDLTALQGWTVDPMRGRLKFHCSKVRKFEPSLKNIRHANEYKLGICEYMHTGSQLVLCYSMQAIKCTANIINVAAVYCCCCPSLFIERRPTYQLKDKWMK